MKKKLVEVFYGKRHPNGSETQCCGPLGTCGFLKVVLELWRFWRKHGTGLDDYDVMEISFID